MPDIDSWNTNNKPWHNRQAVGIRWEYKTNQMQVGNLKEQLKKAENLRPVQIRCTIQMQIHCNTNNTAQPGVDANAMVKGSNNNNNKSFLLV